MISFVICEDEKVLREEYKDIISNYMMNYDYEYKFVTFDGYNEKFNNYIKVPEDFKIYILDIKTNSGTGVDAARKIREEVNDWNSMILIITGLSEFKYEALAKRLMLMDFISKLDNYRAYLVDCISKCLNYYDSRPNKLRYSYKNISYNVMLKHITYIQKEPDSKRCKIYTESNEILPYSGTIVSILELLDGRFIKTSRCTIVNVNQISHYNQKDNELFFDNGVMINDISRENKKKVIDRVRGI